MGLHTCGRPKISPAAEVAPGSTRRPALPASPPAGNFLSFCLFSVCSSSLLRHQESELRNSGTVPGATGKATVTARAARARTPTPAGAAPQQRAGVPRASGHWEGDRGGQEAEVAQSPSGRGGQTEARPEGLGSPRQGRPAKDGTAAADPRSALAVKPPRPLSLGPSYPALSAPHSLLLPKLNISVCLSLSSDDAETAVCSSLMNLSDHRAAQPRAQ